MPRAETPGYFYHGFNARQSQHTRQDVLRSRVRGQRGGEIARSHHSGAESFDHQTFADQSVGRDAMLVASWMTTNGGLGSSRNTRIKGSQVADGWRADSGRVRCVSASIAKTV